MSRMHERESFKLSKLFSYYKLCNFYNWVLKVDLFLERGIILSGLLKRGPNLEIRAAHTHLKHTRAPPGGRGRAYKYLLLIQISPVKSSPFPIIRALYRPLGCRGRLSELLYLVSHCYQTNKCYSVRICLAVVL